jgi:hypothetical protein
MRINAIARPVDIFVLTQTDCRLEGIEEGFELVARTVALRIGPEKLNNIQNT